jgi:ribosomal protein S8
MKTSDPLSDLLTRLRNAMTAGHDRVDVPASRVKEAVLKVLEEEGFIASFRKVQEAGRPYLRVGLKYDPEGEPIVIGIERVSKPGRPRVDLQGHRHGQEGPGVAPGRRSSLQHLVRRVHSCLA